MRVVPDRFLLHAHHWLILHGRYVCIARKPLCGVCVLVDLCPYEPKNLPGEKDETQVARVRKSGMTGGPAGG